jgi:hypothetical protein
MRVCGDAMNDTNAPTCFEVLGDLGTDVRRVGVFAFGLGIDVLEPGPVGADGATSVVVGGDAAGGPLGAVRGPQSTVGVRRWRRCPAR